MAASLILDPLTKALAKLSGEDDDAGRLLWLEFYSRSDFKDRNSDHNKMDLLYLFYAWDCIADHIPSLGGEIASCLHHLKFATKTLHTKRF